jgi:phosphoglycerol transferase MdoB-like AlkP superfamily enzyme
MILPAVHKNRFSILYLFFALFILFSFITRTILLVKSYSEIPLTVVLLFKIYGIGLFFDLITMLYWAIPFAVLLTLLPDKVYQSKFFRPFISVSFFLVIYALLFDIFAEYFFFDEFGTRFNFIAVDYLVYTHEVVKNIIESYPLYTILGTVTALSLVLVLMLRHCLRASIMVKSNFKARARTGLILVALPLLAYALVDISFAEKCGNNYANEVSGNGLYDLFAAFRNNRLQYDAFYATRDTREAFQDLRTLLKEEHAAFVSDDLFDISRKITCDQPENRLNVVVVVVESLSAQYLGAFGNQQNLTPNLDRLAQESILFTNMHATGTRTDRGLEAITLSVPPTPGRSKVKRPHNEDLFTWGGVLQERGYDTKFIYGGNGYFDNMNYFFSHNGFEVVDRKYLGKGEITFENAWGVCDEDLFNKALSECTRSYQNHTPFFALVMTTSNHRPYTYPEGRIDIPSGTGRSGAMKYTDYALGKLIKDAQQMPWFDNTVFLIVADHCASSAGKVSLPFKRYEIPLFIYSPAHFAPQRVDTLASQIDIAPTVLGLLNFSYTTQFFGKDLAHVAPDQGNAFIGTYQKLGYMKKNFLTVLDVKRRSEFFQCNRTTGETWPAPLDQDLLAHAITYYQTADYLFEHQIRNKGQAIKKPFHQERA